MNKYSSQLLYCYLHYSDETEEALFSNIQNNEREEVKYIFRSVEWNAETVASFQKSVQSSIITTLCGISMY